MDREIPRQILALLTFAGVIVHEAVEQFFCRWSGVAVLDVCYFCFGYPAGYVIHEPALNLRKSLVIGLGPFFVNSLLGVLVAFPFVLTALEFRVSTVQSYVLTWLGISIAMHALPSADTAITLWHSLGSRKCSQLTRLLPTSLVRFMSIVFSGRIIGLDLLYGVAVVAAPPAVLLYLLR